MNSISQNLSPKPRDIPRGFFLLNDGLAITAKSRRNFDKNGEFLEPSFWVKLMLDSIGLLYGVT
jgi:hypothetical protein